MDIGPTRWDLVQEFFHRALALPEAERAAFLADHCPDPHIHAEILELLAEDASASSLLDAPVDDIASDLLENRLLPGDRLGPYRIESDIGEGGMGIVYLARREDVGNQVAIKVLRTPWIALGGRARFLREQRLLAHLNHPGIARLLDAGALHDGTPYFVIEYVEGLSLIEHCDRNDVPLRERLRLFREICEAVQFAHRRAIIHRDIKPSNILVTPEGEVKLLDFGIARQMDELGIAGTTTRTLFRLLTPGYASPEQVRGEPATVLTDVYSLGVVLYEMISGALPFRAFPDFSAPDASIPEPEALSTLATRAGRDWRIGGERIPRSTWQDLDVIARTAVDPDSAARYRSVEALARDIDHHLGGEPLEARREPWNGRVRKYLRRNRGPVIGATLAASMLIGSSAVYAVRIAKERSRAQLEASKARQVSDYLFSLFEAADPYGDPNGPTDLGDLLIRGEVRAAELGGEPEVRAQMLDVLGRVQTALGDYARAEDLLARALALRAEAVPASLDVAETLSHLGFLRFHQGQLDDAERVLSEALVIRERELPANHPDLASTLDDLGVIVGTRGDYARAARFYEQALGIRRALHGSSPHEDIGQSLNNMAVNLYNRGDLEGAERYYREAIEVDRSVFGPDHPTLATNLANFGRLYQDRAEYEEAERLLAEALRIRRARLGEEHYETGLSHSQLAALLAASGDHVGAREHFEAALRIQEALLGPDHPSVGTTLNGLAQVLQRAGDAAGAEATFELALATYRNGLGPDHRFTAIVLANMGALHHLSGDRVAAEREFREAIRILEAVHPPDHPELGYNLSRFGAALLDWSRLDEAEPYLHRGLRSMEAAYGPDHERTREAQARVSALDSARSGP